MDHDEKKKQVTSVRAYTEDTQRNFEKGHELYSGRGTHEDPFIVDWDEQDPENPYNWSKARKWLITIQVRCVALSWHFGPQCLIPRALS